MYEERIPIFTRDPPYHDSGRPNQPSLTKEQGNNELTFDKWAKIVPLALLVNTSSCYCQHQPQHHHQCHHYHTPTRMSLLL